MMNLFAILCAATFANPVIPMDFSDPDACVGADGRVYLTASSFGGLPGLPILVSDDCVNWTYVGHALAEHPFPAAGDPLHGKAVWAPSIRYRADRGEYVIYWGDPDRGIYRTSAPRAEGPWAVPRLVVAGKGLIDPCPLYDDDGRVYLANGWAQSRCGFNSVLTMRELDAEETHAVGDAVVVYDGLRDGNHTCEGPKVYKKDGFYWLFFPAGGVAEGWQVVARAESPFGPYAARTVLRQGQTDINGPHQGAWVRLKDGTDRFLHFSDRGAYGRVTYLEPMSWPSREWPSIGRNGEPVARGTYEGEAQRPFAGLAVSDDFNSPRLGLQWQKLRCGADFAGGPTPDGYYRLYGTVCKAWPANLWNEPNLLVQKFPDFAFEATLKARVSFKEPNGEAGLVVMGRSNARIGLRMKGGACEVVYTEHRGADCGEAPTPTFVLGTVPVRETPAGLLPCHSADIHLRLTVREGAQATFAWSTDGRTFRATPQPFAVSPGKWIGATFGLYALNAPECKDRCWIDAEDLKVLPKR